ncbi:ImmA/IrrE family metallo-endopeptidase [Stenotrophomonas sp. 364]|uniref:helix-turn-helix domain-containing protein n=1 Tax=Stenotrophomonas sp. 364 TaxID=2691571 RepID=UPI001315DD2A|nr:ImmA/IrrE family metallo-endopeptidase [Stenotrophomonas sp. 364]QHB72120.1 ImmA/IrrE family metallo-endopeptidase [Stenotrophomonas sp. 364]
MSTFNKEILRTVRQARGKSQSQLAADARVSQAAVSKLEAGLITDPSDEVVDKLAAAVDFPKSIFFESDRSFGLPISLHGNAMYRRKASTGNRALEKLEADLNIRLMHIRRLLAAADIEAQLLLPALDPDEYDGDIELIAEMMRRTWGLPNGPLHNLTDHIERAGIVVIECDMSSIGVDGLTIRTLGAPPCIFIDSNAPGDRQRFTLAHELGHLVMHSVPSSTMEEEANQFASALLMPRRDIRPYLLDRITIQKLAALKPIWRVSMASLLMRCQSIGLVQPSQAQYLWRQMSAMGYRRAEPDSIAVAREPTKVLKEIVNLHLQELGYTAGELAKSLHMHPEELRLLYGVEDQEKPVRRLRSVS